MSASPSATTTHFRTCPLCEGMCGVKITLKSGKIESIRPDHDNVWSRGHICPKGTTLGALHDDPDRIRVPLIRDKDTWREAGWEEALRKCEELIHKVRKEYGSQAMCCYTGNMVGKLFDIGRYLMLFFTKAKLGSRYSSSTIDQQPKNLSSMLLYGDMWKIPVPDVDNTDLFVIFGANPSASKGSIFSHRDVMGAIRALRARGGRVIVVDPVRTGTAQKADEWISIEPGTDAAFLLAIVHTLFEENRVRLGHLENLVNGVHAVRQAAEPFSPEAVARFCGVSAASIRALALRIADAPSAAVYGRIGLCTQRFGSLASWLIDVVAILTGNMDRRGGLMFSTQVAPHMALTPPYPMNAPLLGRFSRVRGVQAILGQLPASCLAEEIDTPGEGQIKGLFTIGANPVVSVPGADRLDAALPLLDFMISLDNYLNETTRHAHVILPSPSVLETPYWDVWAWPWSLTSGGHYSPALYETERMEEWRVITTLGCLCAGMKLEEIDPDALDREYFSGMCAQVGLDAEKILKISPTPGPERILDLAIRIGPFGDRYGERPGGVTLETFKASPQGILFGAAQPQMREVLRTPSGKVELAPEHLLNDIPRLRAAMTEPRPPMLLVSRRHLSSMNSWMHNVEVLVKGPERCTLFVHPRDAERIGVGDGERVCVASTEASVEVAAEITDGVRPGVVSLPHGWGHDLPGSRLRVASRRPGVNSNRLNPATFVDEASGNLAVNGVPVTVTKIGSPP
ncbi:MAG TPA: molybdopterin-dependent oxidoreductase [Steroidobacteraceae bacterium]